MPLAIANSDAGGYGRCQNHPADTRFAGRAQHTQHAVARRNNQFVFMLGHVARKWRSDMQDIAAILERFGPTRVAVELRGANFQPSAGLGMFSNISRKLASRAISRSVPRTRKPCCNNASTQCRQIKPEVPVTATKVALLSVRISPLLHLIRR